MTKVAPLRLLAGLAIGLAGGMLLPATLAGMILSVAKPVGKLWLDALTMTVVPLVFGLLVTGVATTSRHAAAGRTTLKAIQWFAIMLTVASVASAGFTEGLLQLWPVGPDLLDAGVAAQATIPATAPATAWYEGIIPTNPVRAAADMAVVPMVIFALLLGFALTQLERRSADSLLAPIGALVDAMLVVVGWVLLLGPLGIAALAFAAGAHLGVGALGTLAHYVLTVSAACLVATVLAYGWVLAASRVPLTRFARAAVPAQVVALGTQSSLATLSVMVEGAAALRLHGNAPAIVLPLSVSLFRSASVAANVAVALYVAHLHEVPLTFGGLALVSVIAVPVSLAAVGLPAQVSFFATIAPLCLAIDVPVTILPLLLAIETIPDLFRTIGNVTSDLAVTCVVASGDRAPEIDSPAHHSTLTDG